MTPEQIKRVAEIIYPDAPWEIRLTGDVAITEIKGYMTIDDFLFSPAFSAENWQRSQALAVVEWLSDHGSEDQLDTVGRYIKYRDLESLMMMVLELSDE